MAEPLCHEIWIAAPPDRVFPFFTEADRLGRWLADVAQIEPHPGGRFAVDFARTRTQVRGQYVALDPPRRVIFTWGVAGSASLAPGSSRVEVILEDRNGGTRVVLRHHELPEDERDRHRAGWARLLSGLAAAVS